MKWAELEKGKYPALAWLFHIPNGGTRNLIEAVKLKRMGVRPGVSDLFLPCPLEMVSGRHYCGLWIEMKSREGRISDEQIHFRNHVLEQGYWHCFAYSWVQASMVIVDYLERRID